jgi:hypothetical protein
MFMTLIGNKEGTAFINAHKVKKLEVVKTAWYWGDNWENRQESFQVIGHLEPKGLFLFGRFDSQDDADAFNEELDDIRRGG